MNEQRFGRETKPRLKPSDFVGKTFKMNFTGGIIRVVELIDLDSKEAEGRLREYNLPEYLTAAAHWPRKRLVVEEDGTYKQYSDVDIADAIEQNIWTEEPEG